MNSSNPRGPTHRRGSTSGTLERLSVSVWLLGASVTVGILISQKTTDGSLLSLIVFALATVSAGAAVGSSFYLRKSTRFGIERASQIRQLQVDQTELIKSVTSLADRDDPLSRITGIHLLTFYAERTKEVRNLAVSILSAFVRLNSQERPSLGADVELALRGLSTINSLSGVEEQIDLRGVNLSGADLSHLNLSRADLSFAKLSGSNLSFSDLHETVFRGADLSRSRLDGSDLRYAVLDGVDLSGASLVTSDFSGALLRSAELTGAYLAYTRFAGAAVGSVRLEGARVKDLDAESAAALSAASPEIASYMRSLGYDFEPKVESR